MRGCLILVTHCGGNREDGGVDRVYKVGDLRLGFKCALVETYLVLCPVHMAERGAENGVLATLDDGLHGQIRITTRAIRRDTGQVTATHCCSPIPSEKMLMQQVRHLGGCWRKLMVVVVH